MSDEVKLPDAAFKLDACENLFTESQVRAYGEACRKDERKKCAQVCDENQMRCPEGEDEYDAGWNNCCEEIEKEIRERSTP